MSKAQGEKRILALGIEGSANKISVGIVDSTGNILSNPRKTFITPPGTGFLPKETGDHHRENVLGILEKALTEAKVTIEDIGMRTGLLQMSYAIRKDLAWVLLWLSVLLLHAHSHSSIRNH